MAGQRSDIPHTIYMGGACGEVSHEIMSVTELSLEEMFDREVSWEKCLA